MLIYKRTALLTLASLLLCGCGAPTTPQQSDEERIISTAPSLTEILFALDLGSQVKGVTPYCNHPAAAQNVPPVGDLYQPSFESILARKPTHIIMFNEQQDKARKFETLGIETIVLPHDTIEDINTAIQVIGHTFDRTPQAADLVDQIQRSMAIHRHTVTGTRSCLVVISRDYGAEQPTSLYLAGHNNFYDEILGHIGARNAYDGPVPYPAITAEGLLRLRPDLIIDLVPAAVAREMDAGALRQSWQPFIDSGILQPDAVIAVLTNDFLFIPGPRITQTLEQITQCVMSLDKAPESM